MVKHGKSDLESSSLTSRVLDKGVRVKRAVESMSYTVTGLLPDYEIRKRVVIKPFAEGIKRRGKISYGLTSYGYDARIGTKFKIYTNLRSTVVDPKRMDENCFETITTKKLILPPNSYALGETVEYLEIPRDCLALCIGKSTYARAGIIVNVTPLEPEWRGRVTVEISNSTSSPVMVYADEGIMQIMFFAASAVCKTSYGDKDGKYQDQPGLVLPKVD